MKAYEVKDKLQINGVTVDLIRKNDDIYMIMKSFFYTLGFSASQYVEQVKKVFPDAEILDSGEIWLPFKGGALVSNQSHWFVEFKLKEL